MKTLFVTLAALCCLHGALAQHVLARADSLLLNAEYPETLALIDQHIGSADDATETKLLNKKAEALIRLGRLEEAENILKNLRETRDPFLRCLTKTNLGNLYINQGRNDLALDILRETLTELDRLGRGHTLEAAQAMSFLGQVYKFTGKHAQAEEQMQMALSIRQNVLKSDHELIAASFNDLGLVYAQIDNDRALEYYEKALATYQKLHGNDHPKIAISHTNLGFTYNELQLYGDAVNNLETALAIWEKVYSQPHQTKAFVLFNLGQTYGMMGNQDAARQFLDRALDMYRKSYGEKHPEISGVLNAIGNMELGREDHDNAMRHFQEALQANVRDFTSDDESNNPHLDNYYHGNVLLYSMMYKAQALEARHLQRTLKFSDLTLALKTLQSCDTLIDRLRQESTNESDKILLGAIASEVYGDGVRVAYEAAGKAFRKQPFLELAFYFAEKSKSAVLLEAISDSDAKTFAGIPANLLEEEKALKSAIALTAQQLSQKPPAEEEKYLRETSFALKRNYENFVRNLEKQFPAYFNLKFNAAAPSIAQLQALLDENTTLLSYFIDEKRDAKRLYIFLIAKNAYAVTDHALPDDFDKHITGLRNGIYFNVMDVYMQSAMSLSRIVIPKNIPRHTEELVIIPTGRLGIIPFETLFTGRTQANNYLNLPYLLNDYSVRYEFSAGLMLQKSKQETQKQQKILLCAPVAFPEQGLGDLPGTEAEVKAISALFDSRNIGNAVFLRKDANEGLVKNNKLKEYSLLHFATHGVVDENNPELSRIFLQKSTDAEDGNLFATEIYNLELDANLVTLSACQTGLGKISRGEGVIGLSRALVYAGAQNIIVSFWNVADESTATLMTDFYQQLLEKDNIGYSASLRQAKRSLMKNEKYAAPYYWAPFILIGF